MENQEITSRYMKAIERSHASRNTLNEAVTAISNAKEKYDAIAAEETARRVLDDRYNELSPSEKAEWSDRIRGAYRTKLF